MVSWGPYCLVLATNGFELNEIYQDIPTQKIEFKKSEMQKKIQSFFRFYER